MVKINKEGIILRPTNLPFENKSVFNPGILQDGNTVHMIYRAINEKYDSCLGYARFEGPKRLVERWERPFMVSQYKYESRGVEDARITKIGDTIYLVYVAHDGKNARLAYASGKDLFKLKKGGIISPNFSYNHAGKLFEKSLLKDDYYTFKSFYVDYGGRDVLTWDKDGCFFPEKIKGKFALIHRILPDVQVAYARKTEEYRENKYWIDSLQKLNKQVILEPKYGWETRHLGGGCPPIRTSKGWLFIYHGVEPRNTGRIYHAGAVLLDLKNPTKIIARLPKPFMSPKAKYELLGHVDNVVFPTGTALFGNKLYIYYGTADTHIAIASVNINQFLNEILKHKDESIT